MSGAMYVDGDLYGESTEEDVWEVEVSDQSSAISRLVIGLDQILEVNGENVDQIDGVADLEGQISGEAIDDITFETSKHDKQVIEELERKFDGASYYGVEASQEIDDNIILTQMKGLILMKSLNIMELHWKKHVPNFEHRSSKLVQHRCLSR